MIKIDSINLASCILNELGFSSTMKLEKLVYYCQAVALVNFNEPLFDDEIQAWMNGPVIKRLFERHKGEYVIEKGFFGDDKLADLQDEDVASIVHKVLDLYGGKSGKELSEITHSETPWQVARKGLKPSERGDGEITLSSMRDYYENQKEFILAA